MSKFNVILLVEGIDVEDLDQLEAVLDVAPESHVTSTEGITRITATLEHTSASKATLRLVSELRAAIPSLEAVRAEVKLVNVRDIASAAGVNRETVRLWTTGQRGPGDFPAPYATVSDGRMKVWAAADVQLWLAKHSLPTEAVRELAPSEVLDIKRALACALIENTPGRVVDMHGWRAAKSSSVRLSVQTTVAGSELAARASQTH